MNYIKNILVDLTGYLGVDNQNRITKNIYLGNYKCSKKEYIEKHNFDVIINCTPDLPFESKNTSNYRIPVYDDLTFYSNIILLNHVNRIVNIIHNHHLNNKKILIHCRAGMQRSAAIVAAYLIKFHNLSVEDSITFINNRRPAAFMCGSNFSDCLQIYYKTLQLSS